MLWETFWLFLALAISDWLLPRTPLHLRACRLPAVRIAIHYSKTATLVPTFAVEDLPLGRTAALVPEFCSERPALVQNTLMMMMMMYKECITEVFSSHYFRYTLYTG